MECSICIEKFNKSNNKQVKCSYCDYLMCRSCVQTYLISTVDDPHCLNCKKAWNREFVDNAITKVYRTKDFKTHRENLLYSRERSLLPAAQEHIERTKEIDELYDSINKELQQLRLQKKEIENKINKTYNTLNRVRNERNRAHNGNVVIDQTERKTFIKPCPADDCNGFLSTQWKCGLCDTKVCNKCHEVKKPDIDHECNEDNVKSAEEVMKNSKPCPKCGSRIFKIAGCSQMFCTKPGCHTAFDWTTGRIVTNGAIHNPHYFELLRQNGGALPRAHGDIPCGGLPSAREIQTFGRFDIEKTKLLTIIRTIGHYADVGRRAVTVPDVVDGNFDIRVKFLKKDIDEKMFKTILQRREKSREKKLALYMVIDMFVNVGSDLCRQLVNRHIQIADFMEQIEELRRYVNNVMQDINKRFGCTVIVLNHRWHRLHSTKPALVLQ